MPTQDRGKARALAILDAAEHVFAAEGYESATTEGIAARAGASIGSLYQFFPNKRALFDAVSSRYLDRVRALFDVVVPAAMRTATSWEEILDGTVDAFWALDHQSAAFSAVWIQGRITKELMDSAWALNRAFAERAVQIIEHFAPHVPKEERTIVATVVVEAVSGMLFAAARTQDGTSLRLITETKRMLRAYLREVLANTSPGGASAS